MSIDKKSRRLRYATDSGGSKIVDGIGEYVFIIDTHRDCQNVCLLREHRYKNIIKIPSNNLKPDAEEILTDYLFFHWVDFRN